MTHYHVAYGLAGYGPDSADGFASLESLGAALEYAREELAHDVGQSHDVAHMLAAEEDFEGAWRAVERMERIELLRANLDPKRASAPLYAHDSDAYAQLQESQAAEFPHDVSDNSRLYLWRCDEAECKHDDERGRG